MKGSTYKNYDELPLFLNTATVVNVLVVSPSSGYELMHEPDFPVLKVGSRMVVPKEKFMECSELLHGTAADSCQPHERLCPSKAGEEGDENSAAREFGNLF